MKFEVQIEINKPRAEVVELFCDSESYSKWQPGFDQITRISGSPWDDGSVSNLTYKIGRRLVQMQETIVQNNLPDTLTAEYVSKGMNHLITDSFVEVDGSTTRWTSQSNLKHSGFLSLVSILRPNAFRNRRANWLKRFKDFSEVR